MFNLYRFDCGCDPHFRSGQDAPPPGPSVSSSLYKLRVFNGERGSPDLFKGYGLAFQRGGWTFFTRSVVRKGPVPIHRRYQGTQCPRRTAHSGPPRSLGVKGVGRFVMTPGRALWSLGAASGSSPRSAHTSAASGRSRGSRGRTSRASAPSGPTTLPSSSWPPTASS